MDKSTNFKSQISFAGSSSLSPIISEIADKFMSEYVSWDKVSPSFPNEKISITVSSKGSGCGIKSVLDNSSDFGMIARKIKDDEKSKMSNYKEFVIAYDALTVSVNTANPIVKIKDSLDINTIKKIFSGEYKYWSDIDSSLPQKEISVIVRDADSGAYEVFKEYIMGESEISSNAVQTSSMEELCTKISENAVGYASYAIYSQNKDKLSAFKIEGIEPSKENIVNGTYKMQRPLMLIKNSELSESENAFINYVLGEFGKQTAEKHGYILLK